MTDPISDWMIAHLDPSLGPLFLGLIGNWHESHIALLVFFTAYLAGVSVIVHGVWRMLTR